MMGHNISFYGEIWLIIPKLSMLPFLFGPEVIKTCFMLISADHEILNACKYKNIQKFSFFQTQISLVCYFSCS